MFSSAQGQGDEPGDDNTRLTRKRDPAQPSILLSHFGSQREESLSHLRSSRSSRLLLCIFYHTTWFLTPHFTPRPFSRALWPTNFPVPSLLWPLPLPRLCWNLALPWDHGLTASQGPVLSHTTCISGLGGRVSIFLHLLHFEPFLPLPLSKTAAPAFRLLKYLPLRSPVTLRPSSIKGSGCGH